MTVINSTTTLKTWLLILSSFFVAILLVFVHLPSWAEWIYPQWLIVVLLYWVFTMPQRVNLGVAWVIGCLLDIFFGTPLGEHALTLVLITYFIIQWELKIKLLGFFEKSLIVFSLIVFSQLLPLLLQLYFVGRPGDFWPILSRAFVSTLLWLFVILYFGNKGKINFENY